MCGVEELQSFLADAVACAEDAWLVIARVADGDLLVDSVAQLGRQSEERALRLLVCSCGGHVELRSVNDLWVQV